jgi:hypothetical protein
MTTNRKKTLVIVSASAGCLAMDSTVAAPANPMPNAIPKKPIKAKAAPIQQFIMLFIQSPPGKFVSITLYSKGSEPVWTDVTGDRSR